MPAKSKQQQKFFGVVKAMQAGDIPKKGEAGKAAKEMSKKEVDKYASTKHKGLPMKVNENFTSKLNNIMKRSKDVKDFVKNTLRNSDFKLYNEPRLKNKFVSFLTGFYNEFSMAVESIYTNERLGIEIVESSKPFAIEEAEYKGRKVKLGKPMQGDVKKFKVYVKDPKTGNVKKVNFGQKGMVIKKDNPAARKSFRARHKCDQKKDRTSAGYWSCRKW
jgi:hypothetical protein